MAAGCDECSVDCRAAIPLGPRLTEEGRAFDAEAPCLAVQDAAGHQSRINRRSGGGRLRRPLLRTTRIQTVQEFMRLRIGAASSGVCRGGVQFETGTARIVCLFSFRTWVPTGWQRKRAQECRRIRRSRMHLMSDSIAAASRCNRG